MANRYLRMICIRIDPLDSYRENFTFKSEGHGGVTITLPFVIAAFKVGEAVDLFIHRVDASSPRWNQ